MPQKSKQIRMFAHETVTVQEDFSPSSKVDQVEIDPKMRFLSRKHYKKYIYYFELAKEEVSLMTQYK